MTGPVQSSSVQPVLSLTGITKRYGSNTVLGPIDIHVEKGELLTLLGPSGCGKTTTLSIIAGLVAPTEGRLLLEGRDITHVAPPFRDMGLVFQSYALFPHRTVAQNVAFGLRMRNVPAREIADRVRDILEVVGLPNVEDRYPSQLSGGQRQRVALARAVVIEPSILLLDEPLSNLDALLRKRMRYELRDIQKRLGITTIFVTHDQDEAFEMSDRVILMNGGHVEQIGSPEDLYDKPRTEFAANFIGEASLNRGTIVSLDGNSAVISAAGIEIGAYVIHPAAGVGEPVMLMTRPERVVLTPPGTEGSHDLTVVKRTFQGERIILQLGAGDATFLCSVPSLEKYRSIQIGQQVGAVFHESRAIAGA